MEIMIVVGIMGLILLLGVPLVYKIGHRAPMSKAIHDIETVCKLARQDSIFHNHRVALNIRPHDGVFSISSGGTASRGAGPAALTEPSASAGTPDGGTATLTGVHIEDIDIDKIPGGFMDFESVPVFFNPNGTSDELSIFLVSDKGERCEIYLEVSTGLSYVEWDVRRFR